MSLPEKSLFCVLLLGAAVLVGNVWAVPGVAGRKEPGRNDQERILSLLANTSEELRPQVANVIRDQQRRLGGCLDLQRLDADQIWVMDKVDFYDNGQPARGRWQIRYTATLCGQKVQRNAVFTARAGELGGKLDGRAATGVAVEAMAPGATLADPMLMGDAMKSFQMSLMKSVPGCQTPLLKETQVLDQPEGPRGMWRELWVGNACGQDVAQVITFYPSTAGTLFRMSVPKGPVDTLVSRTVPLPPMRRP